MEENLAEVVRVFGIKPAKINVVVMDRDRNAHLINSCQKFGVNLILIKAGDFLPSILACQDPKDQDKGIHLVAGIGGFEEGVLAAVAAKSLDAVGEGKGWSPDQKIAKKYKKSWKIDDLVAGKKEDCLVSVSSITGDSWFDLPRIVEKDRGFKVVTLTISPKGVNIISKVHQ